MIKAAAHVAGGIAVLQSPGQDLIHSRAGNDPELAELRYLPARVANLIRPRPCHPWMDGRKVVHATYFRIGPPGPNV